MNWIDCITKAINYIENNLAEDINTENIAAAAYTSPAHFQLIFRVVSGLTVGEYIRNRRLSLAARELFEPSAKIIDVAMRFQYDTQESFSKAFLRFHGVSPSKINRSNAKYFHPFTLTVTIKGGFEMSNRLIDEFFWNDVSQNADENLTDVEKYKRIVTWAGKARGRNPRVFDALTEWILDDSQWCSENLIENEQVLIHGVFARFREQNARLRAYLDELEAEIVNPAVYKALDRFDNELAGKTHAVSLQSYVTQLFSDFSKMAKRSLRVQIAGNKTGSTGTDSVDIFGYINILKNCDAGVQWALFMPDAVARQQNGFKVASFEYKKMPPLRFIGREGEEFVSIEKRKELFYALDGLKNYKSGFDYDILFMHHYGLGVDAGEWHGFWGRFMQAGTPVPDGFVHFDFIAERKDGQSTVGPPFLSQFAYATFSGDLDAMHEREGFDSDAMYDVTRNIMLGQGVSIPYPDKYWTAEVFPDGCDKYSTAYMFSAEF